jgi:hypothetical protein
VRIQSVTPWLQGRLFRLCNWLSQTIECIEMAEPSFTPECHQQMLRDGQLTLAEVIGVYFGIVMAYRNMTTILTSGGSWQV